MVYSSDFTSLNGIQLLCGDNSISTTLAGYVGEWDDTWTRCADGEHVTKIAVRGTGVLRIAGADNHGATNVKIECSDGQTLEGKGGEEGVWTDFEECPNDMKICGVRAKIEDIKVVGDNTGLNRIQLSCCSKGKFGNKSIFLCFLAISSFSNTSNSFLPKEYARNKLIVGG